MTGSKATISSEDWVMCDEIRTLHFHYKRVTMISFKKVGKASLSNHTIQRTKLHQIHSPGPQMFTATSKSYERGEVPYKSIRVWAKRISGCEWTPTGEFISRLVLDYWYAKHSPTQLCTSSKVCLVVAFASGWDGWGSDSLKSVVIAVHQISFSNTGNLWHALTKSVLGNMFIHDKAFLKTSIWGIEYSCGIAS